jgi:Ulp1 family protease
MHYNGVIALRQRNNLTLIWCDSMQFDGFLAMMTYSQFYHCMERVRGHQKFQPEQIYTYPPLQIRTQTPKHPRQTNGTDCFIFTLMYQHTLCKWYEVNAGQAFTEVRVQDLIKELQEVTPA